MVYCLNDRENKTKQNKTKQNKTKQNKGEVIMKRTKKNSEILRAVRYVAFDEAAWYGPMGLVDEGRDLVSGWLIDLSQGTSDYTEEIQRLCVRLDCTRQELQEVFDYYRAEIYPKEAKKYNAQQRRDYIEMRTICAR